MTDRGVLDAVPAARGISRWQLTDLIDVGTLQSIQDTFARAFGLPTVIVNPDGSNATAITHRLGFCEDLTRTSATGGARCASCDLCAMRDAAQTSEPVVFRCWNGLYDCAIPIAPKGEVVGYFLCGQVFTEEPDPARYRVAAGEIGVDADRYVAALENVKVVDFDGYDASVRSMHVLAQMIADQAAASIDSLRMLEEARRAKEDTAQLVTELDAVLEALGDIASQPDYRSTLEAIADNLARLIPWDSCVIYLQDDAGEELEPVVVRDPYPEAIAAHRPRRGHGIVGKVAASGTGRRWSDLTTDPDFHAIPGVPVEPESALAMPIVYDDETSGVIIVSRFDRRTFTDHELRLLDVFSSQASVAIQLSRLASERQQRLLEERALGRLVRGVPSRLKLDGMLLEIAQVGVDMLRAEVAIVPLGGQSAARAAEDAPAGPPLAVVGIGEAEARELLALLDPPLGARDVDEGPSVARAGERTALVLPLWAGDERFGPAVFLRFGEGGWDQRVAATLAAQASLGLEKARMHERERRSLLEHQRLAELATELVLARDADEVCERLVAKTAAIVGGDVCFIGRLEGETGVVALDVRTERRTEHQVVRPSGRARLAGLRLRTETDSPRSLFDAWAEELVGGLGEPAVPAAYAAEPLRVGEGVLGGLFVAWRSADAVPSPEQRRILAVLAGAAAASLGRFAAYHATDNSLRQRVTELEALTQLARRITGETSEDVILDEVLGTLRRAGRLSGALYAVLEDRELRVRRVSGLDDDDARDIAAAVAARGVPSEGGVIELDNGTRRALVLPAVVAAGVDAVLVAVGDVHDDEQLDRVLATLVRYGGVALENAHLHDRQREAIERLERTNEQTSEQYGRLERILGVHDTLTTAVLEGRGLDSVARSLSTFLQADILIVSAEERMLARWPLEDAIAWRPPASPSPRTVTADVDGREVLAAPAVVEGEVLAWVIARAQRLDDDIERAAVEYGALLAAVDLLRERTALEVETRLRGGFLEDLFSDHFVDDLVVEQGLAFGFDLRRPSRVFLVEASQAGAEAVLDAQAFHGPVLDSARAWGSQRLVAVRGGAVVALVHDDPGEEGARGRFEDHLQTVLRRRFPQHGFTIGVGTACAALRDFGRSYAAARRGLDLLRLLGRSDTVFSFRAMTVETVLLQSSDPEVVLEFIRRHVEPLDRYDRAHSSDLRRTLRVYFEAGRNLEEASRRLHVHVSTLRYRLKKAASLLDIDLKGEASSLDLNVALKAAEVLAVYHH